MENLAALEHKPVYFFGDGAFAAHSQFEIAARAEQMNQRHGPGDDRDAHDGNGASINGVRHLAKKDGGSGDDSSQQTHQPIVERLDLVLQALPGRA